MDAKYIIKLRSRHTGETITLGGKYNSREEALKFANSNCCERCNSIEISITNPDYVWYNKEIGFVSKEWFEKYMEEQNETRNRKHRIPSK